MDLQKRSLQQPLSLSDFFIPQRGHFFGFHRTKTKTNLFTHAIMRVHHRFTGAGDIQKCQNGNQKFFQKYLCKDNSFPLIINILPLWLTIAS